MRLDLSPLRATPGGLSASPRSCAPYDRYLKHRRPTLRRICKSVLDTVPLCDDRHRYARNHPVLQNNRRRTASTDAGALPQQQRWLSRALFETGQNHTRLDRRDKDHPIELFFFSGRRSSRLHSPWPQQRQRLQGTAVRTHPYVVREMASALAHELNGDRQLPPPCGYSDPKASDALECCARPDANSSRRDDRQIENLPPLIRAPRRAPGPTPPRSGGADFRSDGRSRRGRRIRATGG